MLTYKDRVKAWRETKIRHTFEKREINGYMNADDYGTVPQQPGYAMRPFYNAVVNGEPTFWGPAVMAENYVRMLRAHEPYVDPMEYLCCRWRDMLANYRPYRWDETRFPYDELKPLQTLYDINTGIEGDSHCACDYRIGFELGFGGILAKLRACRDANPDPSTREFYDAEETVLLGIQEFIDRHIERIRELLAAETRPEVKQSLTEMLEATSAIRNDPPRNLHQACQFVAVFNCASRIYTRDGAGFQLDGLLYPFYEKDLREGTLDRDKARCLLANLLLVDPHYYQLSGVDENDCDLTNDLSYLILEAADQINIAANLTVRLHKNCDPNFARTAVQYLFKNRNGWPRFCGDRSLAEGYVRNGPDKKTARERIAVGCNWMAVPGREFPMNDTVKINIAKTFAVAMDEMRDTGIAPSTEALFAIYEKHIARAVETVARGVELHLDHQADLTPELVINLMMHNTLETGSDISRCAELFTVGCDGAGLAVAADSFGALEQRVEKEKVLTWDEVYEALATNYAGPKGARVRAILSSSGRYCGGNTAADAWAKRITEAWCRLVKAQKMSGGRQLVPGWFSWSRTIAFGRTTGATPNGRLAGEPISHGANPCPGFRRDGAVTAQSNGIASVQPGYGNTAPLQLEFDPQITAEEGGVDRVLNLLQTHVENGGTLININILDGEKLMAAHANPDEHPDLVVRVTGFTAYFMTLSPEFRQLVVDRFLYGN